MRCVRLLNGLAVGDKKLLVKVDPKTEDLLNEYKKKKEEKGEQGKLGATAEEVDSSTLRDDEGVKSALEDILKEHESLLDDEEEEAIRKKLERKLREKEESYQKVSCSYGSALHQRLKDREVEEAADERDRQKEVEQIDAARRKLIDEKDPNAESIIFQMEQKMQEHLRRRLNIDTTEPVAASDSEPEGQEPISESVPQSDHRVCFNYLLDF
ncbi:hypothetical protein X801_06919 [Opisthorchis viverrini]|uniref:Uncharacterized protein n=1 Tax=Opisthorchis viverrini TaxID=6198 RepID=A0A1S8WRV4_OPIVI|nr:hypothetical protein X801_06919 [Opisthorchis viverrini]